MLGNTLEYCINFAHHSFICTKDYVTFDHIKCQIHRFTHKPFFLLSSQIICLAYGKILKIWFQRITIWMMIFIPWLVSLDINFFGCRAVGIFRNFIQNTPTDSNRSFSIVCISSYFIRCNWLHSITFLMDGKNCVFLFCSLPSLVFFQDHHVFLNVLDWYASCNLRNLQ